MKGKLIFRVVVGVWDVSSLKTVQRTVFLSSSCTILHTVVFGIIWYK